MAEALGHAQLALGLYRDEGYQPGQARMLNGVGYIHAQLGEYQQALEFCEQALSMNRGRGDPLNEGATWDSVGYVLYHLGRFGEAITHIRTALDTIEGQAAGDYQTTMLVHLGDAYHAAGDRSTRPATPGGKPWPSSSTSTTPMRTRSAPGCTASVPDVAW